MRSRGDYLRIRLEAGCPLRAVSGLRPFLGSGFGCGRWYLTRKDETSLRAKQKNTCGEVIANHHELTMQVQGRGLLMSVGSGQ
jgi:hypothetical protein